MSAPRPVDRPEQLDVAAALRACRGALFGIGILSIFVNLLMLTGPLFMLQIYDRVLTSGSVPTLVALLVLVFGLFCFMGLLELVRSRILVRIGLRIDRILSMEVFRSVTRPFSPRGRHQGVDPLRDLDQLRQFISGPGPLAFFDMPWMPIYFAVIFFFHWWLGLVAVGGAAILLALSLVNEYATRRPLLEATGAMKRAYALADAGRRNAEVLQAMGMQAPYRDKWQDVRSGGLDAHRLGSDVAGTLTSTTKSLRLFLQSLMLAVGAYLAIKQVITPGVMIAASIILSRALAPIEQAIAQWRGLMAARQASARLKANLADLTPVASRMELPEPKGQLAIDHVSVQPPGADSNVLKNIDFTLEAGQGLGVIGPSASGKSTLARALVGVWPPSAGRVRLDGAELGQWPPAQLGSCVGYLPQNVELFEGTVAENIARFDPDPKPEDIVAAARNAGVHELILGLPDGYATNIGEDGTVLSAGQRQRVALARALYGQPVLVVLDEPNANLDAEGDEALTHAIRTMRENGTTVVVMAHRPSAIAAVDQLLVLRDGLQVAFGEKDDVLRKTVTMASTAGGDSNDEEGRARPSRRRA